MIEGFRPPGRKKFISEASTNGSGLVGVLQPLTVNGLAGRGCPEEAASTIAALKFFTIRSPRIVFALMGRFRWRPPLKLYARLSAKPWPRSRSILRFACCEYA